MKLQLSLLIFIIAIAACHNPFLRTISGNGNIITSERNVSSFTDIKCSGSYDVEITQDNAQSLKIEADENIQEYIITQVNGNELNIHVKDDVNLNPSHKIKLFISVPKLEAFRLSGSGNISTTNKITGGDHLILDISGSGNMHFDVNTPSISSNISGSGDIFITGETKDSKIEIAGTGNYHAEDLKSENASVKIAGTGDARLFADSTLKIDVAGMGNVFYKGNASVTQNIAGSGKIKRIE